MGKPLLMCSSRNHSALCPELPGLITFVCPCKVKEVFNEMTGLESIPRLVVTRITPLPARAP